jgi:xanthine dehydrogenase accessory factor
MRHELPAMISLAERLLNAGVTGTLATLFSARGSSYRPLGSMMVALPGAPPGAGAGMRAGGVSGGCVEDHVARHASFFAHDQSAALLSFNSDPDFLSDDRTPPGAPPGVLGCGGSIEVLVERLAPHHLALLHELAHAHERDEPSLLACTVECRGDSVIVNRKWLKPFATPDSSVGRVTAAARRECRSGHALLDAMNHRAVLVHYIPPLTRLVIFGAGDDARPLWDLGHSLGWHVTVADRHSRLVTPSRFPHASRSALLCGDWERIVPRIRFTPRTAVVLMTHSLSDDARVLSRLADKTGAYLGVLGPAHRRERLLAEIAGDGAALSDRLATQLHGPVGLDLGDRTATGIAVSIVAEILATLNNRDAQPLFTSCRRQNVLKLQTVTHG